MKKYRTSKYHLSGKLVGHQRYYGFIDKLSRAVVSHARNDLRSKNPEIRADAESFFCSEDGLVYCEIANKMDLWKG